MARKKPLPRNRRVFQPSFTTLTHEDATVKIYSSGMLTIKGSVKNAAFALAKHVLDDKGSAIGVEYNRCIRVKCKPGKPYTIEWLGKGILPDDDAYPEPKFWAEFKTEFERFCELKAFI
jgi:hypothetical protein